MRLSFSSAEPMRLQGLGSAALRRTEARRLLGLVGLRPEHEDRYPHEFSGGQCQRNRLAALTSAKLDEIRPDIWISLGVAPGLSVVAVERLAANVMDFPIADNVGTQHGGHPVFEGGPAGHLSTLPVKTIADELRAAGIPAKVSNSPSTYLCNQMMYTVLHLITDKALNTRAGFIHVPAHPSYVAKQNYPFVDMPSMSIELMTAAVKHAIATSIAVEHDHRRPGFNY